ncbi:MAG: NAD-dependent epimerase/dehydratase family protein [Gemmatimonadetes bacterium]|nr:NAD-dependent epimerase/dehydratase family protein [Gemmatimonadota bacterium]
MKALVTGGGGFLGLAIVRNLRARGDEVRSFSRGAYPALEQLGVESVRGDLADEAAVLRAARGCDIVFHVAAKAGVWGSTESYHRANVVGTDNVLKACSAEAIQRLVYTSTPSVTFAGTDQIGVDESAPYAERYLSDYPRTKSIAERRVLESNGADLATVALRPHLIWGPGDPHLVPRILDRGRSGTLCLLGDRPNEVDSVYVDNAADAHVLAADRLAPGSVIAGKAYFISQGEPLPLADLVNRILAAGGLPPVKRRIPAGVAYFLGALMESVYGLLGIENEPPLTRFVARQLSTAHWFDISAARRDLGYEPAISLDEGMERLAASLRS